MKRKDTKRKEKKPLIPEQGNSEFRKEFYKRLLYLVLGIIPLFLLWKHKGPERFIAVAGFLLAMYQLIVLISLSPSIVDDFFPPKRYIETKTKPVDKFVLYFAMTLLLVGLIFVLFEIPVIENTVHGMVLFWKSAFVGILAALLLTAIIKFTTPSVYYMSSRRYLVHVGLFLGFFVFTPSLASFINHHFSDNRIKCLTYPLVNKDVGGKRSGSFWIFLKLDENSEERFNVSQRFYDKVSEGDQVNLCTKKGKLGYDFVETFKTIDE